MLCSCPASRWACFTTLPMSLGICAGSLCSWWHSVSTTSAVPRAPFADSRMALFLHPEGSQKAQAGGWGHFLHCITCHLIQPSRGHLWHSSCCFCFAIILLSSLSPPPLHPTLLHAPAAPALLPPSSAVQTSLPAHASCPEVSLVPRVCGPPAPGPLPTALPGAGSSCHEEVHICLRGAGREQGMSQLRAPSWALPMPILSTVRALSAIRSNYQSSSKELGHALGRKAAPFCLRHSIHSMLLLFCCCWVNAYSSADPLPTAVGDMLCSQPRSFSSLRLCFCKGCNHS